MVQRRPVIVLLFISAALVAALGIPPAMSADPGDGAHASTFAAAGPYGRLAIAQDGINARISSHQIGVNKPGQGAANLGPLTVATAIDADAVTLFEDVTQGVHLQEVVVRVFKPNSTVERIRYTLEDALVTDLQHGGSTESLSFIYDRITVEVAGNSYCYDVQLQRQC